MQLVMWGTDRHQHPGQWMVRTLCSLQQQGKEGQQCTTRRANQTGSGGETLARRASRRERDVSEGTGRGRQAQQRVRDQLAWIPGSQALERRQQRRQSVQRVARPWGQQLRGSHPRQERAAGAMQRQSTCHWCLPSRLPRMGRLRAKGVRRWQVQQQRPGQVLQWPRQQRQPLLLPLQQCQPEVERRWRQPHPLLLQLQGRVLAAPQDLVLPLGMASSTPTSCTCLAAGAKAWVLVPALMSSPPAQQALTRLSRADIRHICHIAGCGRLRSPGCMSWLSASCGSSTGGRACRRCTQWPPCRQ